jgi:hypothetical protein
MRVLECDSLSSCTENYLDVDVDVDVYYREYDDELLLESYIQDVDYVERIPASTILYITNTTQLRQIYLHHDIEQEL